MLGGCGADDEAASGVASLVPPDAPLYLEVALFPDDDRTEAIASLTDRIGGISDPEGQVASLIDAEFAGAGVDITYAEDIEPWLGDSAAAFVRSFEPSDVAAGMVDAAYLIAVDDVAAAEEFLGTLAADAEADVQEKTYDDVTYLTEASGGGGAAGLVDGTLVVGTEPGFKAAVDASTGDSLADADEFSEEVGELDDDAVAELWIDLGTALDAAAAQAGADAGEIDAARAALEPLLAEPLTARLEATTETVALETSAAGGIGFGGNTELLGQMPAESWFALAITEAGDAVRESLGEIASLGAQMGDPALNPDAIVGAIEGQTGLDLEEDLLAWLGNAAFFVSGTSEPDLRLGGLLETSDPAASESAIATAEEQFGQATGAPTAAPKLEGATAGFSATGPGGASVEIALRDDLVVGAFGGPDPATELRRGGGLAGRRAALLRGAGCAGRRLRGSGVRRDAGLPRRRREGRRRRHRLRRCPPVHRGARVPDLRHRGGRRPRALAAGRRRRGVIE